MTLLDDLDDDEGDALYPASEKNETDLPRDIGYFPEGADPGDGHLVFEVDTDDE